jgi:hypothetical protein
MFDRCTRWKNATAICSLASIICATALAPAMDAGACAERLLTAAKKTASCSSRVKLCCCTLPEAAQACRCQSNSDPEAPIGPISINSGPILKWASTQLFAHALIRATAVRSPLAPACSFHSPAQRSLQALLCIWRT